LYGWGHHPIRPGMEEDHLPVTPSDRTTGIVLAVAALALGGVIGFLIGSSRVPSDVLVPGRPTTLHIFRVDPVGSLPTPGNGETVIFDQRSISRIAAELNRLPPFPTVGQHCDANLLTYELSFDYSNGDQLTVDVRQPPCGKVTIRGEDTSRADALNSQLLDDVTTLLKPG
jgi:hypothetical protein